MSDPSFAMLTCACGAETVVKEEMGTQGWRLAFSRPGFVTAKHDSSNADLPQGVFIRTAAHSLGKASGDESSFLIAQLEQQLESSSAKPFDQFHVWPKDRARSADSDSSLVWMK